MPVAGHIDRWDECPPVSSYCLLKELLGLVLDLTGPPNHHLEGYQTRHGRVKVKVIE